MLGRIMNSSTSLFFGNSRRSGKRRAFQVELVIAQVSLADLFHGAHHHTGCQKDSTVLETGNVENSLKIDWEMSAVSLHILLCPNAVDVSPHRSDWILIAQLRRQTVVADMVIALQHGETEQ